jgi:hypothetical protein
MRNVYYGLLSLLVLFSSLSGRAQAQEGLYKDAKGRYLFNHTALAAGAGKAQLYARLKSFVINDLNASDTHIAWDEVGNDSVTTVAFIELGDGPEMANQLVDCKAKLEFMDGQAILRLSGFIYSGKLVDSHVSYARALHRMNPVPYTAQEYALAALGETLRQLMVRMDALANREEAVRARGRK